MRRYTLAHRNSLDGIVYDDSAPMPELRSSTDIRIQIKALSLNARDLQIATGVYPAPHDVPADVVPISDGAGIVEAVGKDVTAFKVGDRVIPVFPQGHHYEEDMALRSLKRGLGGGIDGVAADYFVCDEQEAISLPDSMSYEEGSTFPVAGATAWSSLFSHHPKLQAGQTVLALGTGGVSLMAAQVALCAGARVILTSSSSAKLERAKTLLSPLARNQSADVIQTINYSEVQDWDKEAIKLNGGKGVDFVIEIGGRGTIARSIRASRQGALVAVSGYMSDYGKIDESILKEDIAKTILYSAAAVRGVFVCNREELKTMVSAFDFAAAKPIIDKTFDFADLKDAYQYMADGKHFGKVCVKL